MSSIKYWALPSVHPKKQLQVRLPFSAARFSPGNKRVVHGKYLHLSSVTKIDFRKVEKRAYGFGEEQGCSKHFSLQGAKV